MKAKHTFNSKNECAKANLDKTKTTEWKKVGKAQKNDQDGLMGKPANRYKINKTNKCNNPNEQKAPSITNAGVANLLHPNPKHPSTTNAGMANVLHPHS